MSIKNCDEDTKQLPSICLLCNACVLAGMYGLNESYLPAGDTIYAMADAIYMCLCGPAMQLRGTTPYMHGTSYITNRPI